MVNKAGVPMSRTRSLITSECSPRNSYAAERSGMVMRTTGGSRIKRKARVLATLAFVAVNAMIVGSLSPEAMAATENVSSIYQNLGVKN